MTVYDDAHSQYITELFAAEDEALRRARETAVEQGLPAINIKPEEGRFLQLIVRACGALKVIEIGALGGYSGTWIARGLPPSGRLITLEKEPDRAGIARQTFIATGVADRVDIRIGDARQSLQVLAADAPFDFVFIDADKESFNDYLDWALDNVRVGGMIAAHNAFRKGSIAGDAPPDNYTEIMRTFNQRFASEPRLLGTIFPAGDGMLAAVKIQ